MAKAERNAVARRHLDARVNKQTPVEKLARPPRGWIKAIREALGMSTAQLARRMEISQPGVVMLEQSEALGTIKLETLQRVAEAMNCQLVYALVPNEPLETMIRERARQIARQHLGSVEHSMRLENQGVEDRAAREQQLDAMASQIDARNLWDEP
jgi:predicted DNA-binding mobile mystery protein A